jgi:hypothetical protein
MGCVINEKTTFSTFQLFYIYNIVMRRYTINLLLHLFLTILEAYCNMIIVFAFVLEVLRAYFTLVHVVA